MYHPKSLILSAVVLLGLVEVAATSATASAQPTASSAVTAQSYVATRTSDSLSASWSRTRSTLYQRAAVSGRLSVTDGQPRRVRAEIRIPGQWRRIAVGWTDTNGRYRLALPTSWYHRKKVRVVAYDSSAATTSVTRVVAPSYRPRGSARDWSPLSDTRMRWNPCTPISWKFNGHRAPRGALADTRRAFRRVTQATGLRFRYQGGTRVIPGTSKAWPTNTQIVVAFARPSESKWNLRGNVVGRGGPTDLAYGQDAAGSVWRIVRAGVVIDSTARLRGGFRVGDDRGRLLMHEIGHALGLLHATHSSQLMHGVINSSIPARWGAGDLAGLRTLGLGAGCVGAPRAARTMADRPRLRPVADRVAD